MGENRKIFLFLCLLLFGGVRHMTYKESKFQHDLMREIENLLPGAIVLKMETYIQGFPDLLILYGDRGAALECKRDAKSERQPNQTYYVNLLDYSLRSYYFYLLL